MIIKQYNLDTFIILSHLCYVCSPFGHPERPLTELNNGPYRFDIEHFSLPLIYHLQPVTKYIYHLMHYHIESGRKRTLNKVFFFWWKTEETGSQDQSQ